MSRVYDALRQMEKEQGHPGASPFPQPTELLGNSTVGPAELEGVASVKVKVTPSSRLVALSEPRSLGAEKFRALVTRLENLRRQNEMKSLQITSGVINEGKTSGGGEFGGHVRKTFSLEGAAARRRFA